MNFISYIMIVIYFCFVGINCKSIHVHDDFHSEVEVSEGKPLNHRHDSKSKVSWIKLKPIIRREMQYIKYVKGANSTAMSAETTHQIPTDKEKSNKNLGFAENEEISFNVESQISNNNKMETDIAKSNLTKNTGGDSSILEEFVSNDTNVESSKQDSPLKKNDFPYITPDIMNQSGDLIVFLALDEDGNKIDSLDSKETHLINEGTRVTLEEISPTGLELLTDFKTQQNLIEIKLPNIEKTLNDEKNLNNLRKDFNVDALKINRSEDRVLLEITEETSSISEFSQTSTKKSEIFNSEQTLEVSLEDDSLERSLNENSFTDLKSEYNITDANLTSNQSKMRELQEISSDAKSNTSEIGLITGDLFQIEITKPDHKNVFKDDEQTEVSNKRQSYSKCPDPGLCIFWFLTLDTCDEDSHCHGSLICCKWGCSKMCIDSDFEMA